MDIKDIVAVGLIMALGLWFLTSMVTAQSTPTPNNVAGTGTNVAAQPALKGSTAAFAGTGTGSEVTVPIKVVAGRYEPHEVRVKQGTKVNLVLDTSTFVGCMRVFNIWGYDQKLVVSEGNNVLSFVADKAGTYKTSCGMGMGDGRLIVEPSDGSAIPTLQATGSGAGPSGGTCGGSGGGCGCGGA